MPTYVYCSRPSDSAKELAKTLNATRLRKFDGMSFWAKKKRIGLKSGDNLVCWGNPFPEIEGIKVLNGGDYISKAQAAMKMATEGVPTISVWRERPSPKLMKEGSVAIPRRNDHVGGNDLLVPTKQPNFWVLKEDIVEEYRIHSFGGKSIRAGKKIVREGFTLAKDEAEYASKKARGENVAHPWIRSFDGGWRICYDGFKSTKKMRATVHAAVKSLGLVFGAVDLGKRGDGTFLVLEVNRAPGLEGNSIGSYAQNIKEWFNGTHDARVGGEGDAGEEGGDAEVFVPQPRNRAVAGAFQPQAARPRPAGNPDALRGEMERLRQQFADLQRRAGVAGPAVARRAGG